MAGPQRPCTVEHRTQDCLVEDVEQEEAEQVARRPLHTTFSVVARPFRARRRRAAGPGPHPRRPGLRHLRCRHRPKGRPAKHRWQACAPLPLSGNF